MGYVGHAPSVGVGSVSPSFKDGVGTNEIFWIHVGSWKG